MIEQEKTMSELEERSTELDKTIQQRKSENSSKQKENFQRNLSVGPIHFKSTCPSL